MKGSTKLVLTIIALVLIPFIYLALFYPVFFEVTTLFDAFTVVGRSLALASLSLICINLILSAKLKIIDKWYGGLDKVVKVHRWVGITAYSLIFFHPILLGLRFAVFSWKDVLNFYLTFNRLFQIIGEITFLLFTIIIAFTLLSSREKIKYETLKFIHRFMGLVVALALLHGLLAGFELSNFLFLKIYYVTLFIIAIVSYINRSWFDNSLLGKRYLYEVEDVKPLSESITQVKLCPVGERMKHVGGQFQFISVQHKGFPSEVHPFTISSGSNEECIRLSIETYGDFTKQIPSLKKGYRAYIDGPYGGFTLDKAKTINIVMLAGNVGITPLLSMIRSLGGYPWGYKIYMIHSQSDKGFGVFNDELKDIEKKNKDFKFEPYDTSKEGHLDLVKLKQRDIDWKNSSVFICGSAKFNHSMIKYCKELGVNSNDIHFEEFKLL